MRGDTRHRSLYKDRGLTDEATLEGLRALAANTTLTDAERMAGISRLAAAQPSLE